MAGHSHFGAGSDSTQQGIHSAHVPNFLDEMSERGETELLEMLHMPILHGGVKEVILLSGLTTASAGSFTAACLVLTVCVVLLELLRLLVGRLENQFSGGNSAKTPDCECKHCTSMKGLPEWKQYDAIHDPSLPQGNVTSPTAGRISTKTAPSKWIRGIVVGGLHFLVYLFSTLLMLIAMTMNIYLIISMAFGSAIGKIAVLYLKQKLQKSH